MGVKAAEPGMPDLEASVRAVRRALGGLPAATEIARVARCVDAEVLAGASMPDQLVPPSEAIPGMIDHTILRPDTGVADVERACAEALTYGFAAVCVNPRFVPVVARCVRGSSVRVCAVVGFPLGASATAVKAIEAAVAIEQGALELDMVLPVGPLKAGALEEVGMDIATVVAVAHARQGLVKVILETGLLSPAEQVRACLLARGAGADFVKTSTGFHPRGAHEDEVRRLRALVAPEMGVKASGGIRTRDDVERMIRAGATRIGTSGSVAIMHEYHRPTRCETPAA